MAADELLAALHEATGREFPHYADCLRGAFCRCEPVFVRDGYADFFLHCCASVDGWLPQVILANASTESDGSAKLVRLFQRIGEGDPAEEGVLAHARDEAGHARIFVKLAGQVFPHLMEPDFQANWLRKMSRVSSVHLWKEATPIDDVGLLDNLVQMNLGEIRTRLHMHLFAPVLTAFAPPENRADVEATVRRLHDDELRHIGYTAALIDDACSSHLKPMIERLFLVRLREFHTISVEQTTESVRRYGQGKFPGLLALCSCHWCPSATLCQSDL